MLFRTFKLCKPILCLSFMKTKPQITVICNLYYHNLTRPKLTSKCNRRYFFNWSRKLSEAEFKRKDSIPDEYKLIYNTTLDKYLVLGQIFTVFTIAAFGLTIILTNDVVTGIPKIEEHPMLKDNPELIVYTVSLTFLFVLMQQMFSRIPIRIYKSPITKEYLFVRRGMWPNSRKYFTCVANQLQKIEGDSPFIPWKSSTYKLVKGNNERKLVLMDYYFKRPADLNILLGYQQEDD